MSIYPTTDQGKRAWLREGKPLVFDPVPTTVQESADSRATRTVRSSWLEELAPRPGREVSVAIKIANAIILGPLDLRYASFKFEVNFRNVEFADGVLFSFATFSRGATFHSCQFRGTVDFRATHSYGDFDVNYSTYDHDVSFQDIRVDECFDAVGARFKNANFERARVAKSMFFFRLPDERAASFSGEARFLQTDVTGQAIFDQVLFGGDALFLAAHIGAEALFRSAQFARVAGFERIKIDGAASFEPDGSGRPVTFNGPARFGPAQVAGKISFLGAQFLDEANFDNINVTEDALFGAIQRAGGLISTQFSRKLSFQSAFIRGNTIFERARFCNEASFRFSRFNGGAGFGGAQFNADVIFDGAEIGGPAFFRSLPDGNPIVFSKNASFFRIKFRGDLNLQSAQFQGNVGFDGSQIDGTLFCRPDNSGKQVLFDGEVSFRSVQIGGNAEFDGTQFKQTASFDGIVVLRTAFFRTDSFGNPIRFVGPARFHDAQVSEQASFVGAQFESRASFDGIRFRGVALFIADPCSQPVRFKCQARFPSASFEAEAEFRGAEFYSSCDFQNARFKGASDFRDAKFKSASTVAFTGSHFESSALFQSVDFSGMVDFSSVVVAQTAFFQNVEFRCAATFQKASIGSLLFQNEQTDNKAPTEIAKFHAGIDLRGVSYGSASAPWPDLLRKLAPYDRHPFTYLEKYLRSVGQEEEADNIYCMRRTIERKQKWERQAFVSWMADVLYWRGANYGVRPYRLLFFTAIVLAFGVFVFMHPHTVTNREVALRNSDPTNLYFLQAVGVSIHQFLPVDIPSGSQWLPTEARVNLIKPVGISASTYASIHRLLGWLLVPLGVAALAGALHRKART